MRTELLHFRWRFVGYLFAIKANASAVCFVQTDKASTYSGFSASAFSDDSEYLASPDIEAHIINSVKITYLRFCQLVGIHREIFFYVPDLEYEVIFRYISHFLFPLDIIVKQMTGGGMSLRKL